MTVPRRADRFSAASSGAHIAILPDGFGCVTAHDGGRREVAKAFGTLCLPAWAPG